MLRSILYQALLLHGSHCICGTPWHTHCIALTALQRAVLTTKALDDKSYVVSFDDKLLQLKREARDDVLYLDLKQQGNMMRLINDSQAWAWHGHGMCTLCTLCVVHAWCMRCACTHGARTVHAWRAGGA